MQSAAPRLQRGAYTAAEVSTYRPAIYQADSDGSGHDGMAGFVSPILGLEIVSDSDYIFYDMNQDINNNKKIISKNFIWFQWMCSGTASVTN